MEASKQVKMEGKANDLMERLQNDSSLKMDKSELGKIMDPVNFIGFAPVQTEEFIRHEVQPVLERYSDLVSDGVIDLKV